MRSRGIGRLPPAWHEATASAMAFAITALLCLLAAGTLGSVANTHWLAPGLLLLGPLVALLSFLIRPWTLLSRLGQPLAPRHAGFGLLAPTMRLLLQRDALAQALGWTVATMAGATVGTLAAGALAPRWHGGALDGREVPVAIVLGLWTAALIGLPLHRLPGRWARARLEGRIDGRAASTGLARAADLMLTLVLVLGVLALSVGAESSVSGVRSGVVVTSLAPGAAAWLGLYLLCHRALLPRLPARAALWLALPAPTGGADDDAGARRTGLALAQQLAAGWREGPVTVLLPAGMAAGGEHRLAAHATGRERALFPGRPVERVDWRHTLPPDDRWHGLPLRELHLEPGVMVDTARALMGPGDRLLLLDTGDADAVAWRPLLRDHPSHRVRIGHPSEDGAGPDVAAGDTGARRLRRAALQALQPLRPGALPPVLAADAAPTSAPSAALAMTTVRPPALRPLAAFVSLALMLLLGGYGVLSWRLAAATDPVFAELAGMRPPAAVASVDGSSQSGVVAVDQVPMLRALLADRVRSGQLTVAALVSGIVVTVPSDALFGSGDADLNVEAQALVREVGEALDRATISAVTVQAHTDGQRLVGLRWPSNIELSRARADAVAAALRASMARVPVRAIGLGDSQPQAVNDTADGRAQNRRIEIVAEPAARAAR